MTMKLIHAPEGELALDPGTGVYVASPFDATRELELKNFYQLAGQRVDPKTLQLTISQGDDSPPRTIAGTDLSQGRNVPFVEALGLDNFNESGGFVNFNTHGHDGLVDGTQPTSNFRGFVDFERGTLWLPDLRPFAPRLRR